MGEPSKVRTKSISDIAQQVNRVWAALGRNGSDARHDVVRKAYLRYQENMLNSPAMQRAMRRAGVTTDSDRNAFLSSFGGGMEVQVPVSQYRKNNRR